MLVVDAQGSLPREVPDPRREGLSPPMGFQYYLNSILFVVDSLHRLERETDTL
jgi:hypothetical protein